MLAAFTVSPCVRRYDHLPYIPFPESWPVFTPRDKVADWLESYSKPPNLPNLPILPNLLPPVYTRQVADWLESYSKTPDLPRVTYLTYLTYLTCSLAR